MRIRALLLIVFVIAILTMRTTMTDNANRTVVCFGDSITHGAKVSGRSWVYWLAMEHKNYDFVNEGRN